HGSEHELVENDTGWGSQHHAASDALRFPCGVSPNEAMVDLPLSYMRASAGPVDAMAAFRMLYESDVREVLDTIRVPTLVLSRTGEAADEGAAFARLIPGAIHRAMPGTAPYVITEH